MDTDILLTEVRPRDTSKVSNIDYMTPNLSSLLFYLSSHPINCTPQQIASTQTQYPTIWVSHLETLHHLPLGICVHRLPFSIRKQVLTIGNHFHWIPSRTFGNGKRTVPFTAQPNPKGTVKGLSETQSMTYVQMCTIRTEVLDLARLTSSGSQPAHSHLAQVNTNRAPSNPCPPTPTAVALAHQCTCRQVHNSLKAMHIIKLHQDSNRTGRT